MKISASVYSNTSKPLNELIKELDAHHVDYFHIDCNDDPTVFEDIAEIKKSSKTPVDLHIISNRPEKYFEGIAQHGVEMVTFQYENLPAQFKVPDFVKAKLGLAIISETDNSVFEKFKDRFDFILFMTTTPGKSGGTFNKENFKKIRKFHQVYPDKKVHVDGGVNADISFALRNLGVYSIVSGSYLVNSEYIGTSLHNLRSNYYVPNELHVKDMMMELDELPVLNIKDCGFINILKSIDNFNLTFMLVVNDAGKLEGLVSNADVRKVLIKKFEQMNSITVNDLINRNPISVYDDLTISQLIDFVKNVKFNILYLPVIDRQNNLNGAITFTNLIKGE